MSPRGVCSKRRRCEATLRSRREASSALGKRLSAASSAAPAAPTAALSAFASSSTSASSAASSPASVPCVWPPAAGLAPPEGCAELGPALAMQDLTPAAAPAATAAAAAAAKENCGSAQIAPHRPTPCLSAASANSRSCSPGCHQSGRRAREPMFNLKGAAVQSPCRRSASCSTSNISTRSRATLAFWNDIHRGHLKRSSRVLAAPSASTSMLSTPLTGPAAPAAAPSTWSACFFSCLFFLKVAISATTWSSSTIT
mmetsp:Transcript_19623/g.60945  ORF Transcript_19623/g.60945 Transcript_19623/m.60945 type:complete len:256 (+) Transcript_19623:574-1341(+)